MKKIGVITGTRADYGLLFWSMKEIQKRKDLRLQVYVTGMHLEEQYGNTFHVIEEDGFPITQTIPLDLSDNSGKGVAESMGRGFSGFAEGFEKNKPDLILLLGDRFEILVAAQVAMVMNIPIAHIHGGEATEGLIDEAIRHSVTKMSHLHFPANEIYKKRILQLGEEEWRVHNFGAPGLDFIKNANLMSRSQLEDSIGVALNGNIYLVTYHPVTLDFEESLHGIKQLTSALETLENSTVIITMPNADPGSSEIFKALEDLADSRDYVHGFTSLGQIRYLSLMGVAQCVVGNSSSGIIEAPFLGVPTINIGNRQKGRVQAPSVVQVSCDRNEILTAISEINSPEFQERIDQSRDFFGKGDTSQKIIDYLEGVNLKNVLIKTFCNLV